jgi:hypothetical protein
MHKGYGQFYVGQRTYRAHRVAYELATGEWPGELFVCHHCDNPGCVNPDLLWLGTPRDNTRDMFRKGRANRNLVHGRSWQRTHGDRSKSVWDMTAGTRMVRLARMMLAYIENHERQGCPEAARLAAIARAESEEA